MVSTRALERIVVGLVVLGLLGAPAFGPIAAPQAAAAVRLKVNPARGSPGTVVRVRGAGFREVSRGRLTWSGDGKQLATVRTNRQGSFSANIRVPDEPVGSYQIIAEVRERQARARFVVEAAPTEPPIALGVFVPGAPGKPRRLDAFAERIGRKPAVVMWYQAWGGEQAEFDPALLDAVIGRGATPLITWEPWEPGEGVSQPDFRLDRIADGAFDAYIDQWATALAAYDARVYLRFAHEMNGDWYPWAGEANGNTPEDYVAAWRHLHDRFLAAGATNVRWVWSPNVVFPGSTPLDQLYPGNAYVDWVGLDGYNWGGRKKNDWRSAAKVFGASYAEVTGLTNKPVMIAETASAERGGNKAAWIREAYLDAIPDRFPRVQAVIWFNADKERDWRVNSSDASLKAFRRVARSPKTQGTLP